MDPLLLGFIAGLAAQVASDYALARWHTIPRLRALVYADAARLLDEKLPKPPAAPGAMRGDMDPHDLNARKAAKREAEAIERATNKSAIITKVAAKLGSADAASAFWSWLEKRHPDVADTAVRYTDGWTALKPFLAIFQSPAAAAERATETPLQTE